MSALHSMYFVSTRKPKGKRFNMKINEELRQEFTAASEIIGLRMSQVVHQFIVKTVNEVKDKYPVKFNEILSQIKEEEASENLPDAKELKKRSKSARVASAQTKPAIKIHNIQYVTQIAEELNLDELLVMDVISGKTEGVDPEIVRSIEETAKKKNLDDANKVSSIKSKKVR